MTPKWIRSRLDETGRSQADLARHLGVSEPTMSKIMAGLRQIRATEAEKIYRFFGMTTAQRDLTDDERRFLRLLEQLTPENRLLAASMLEALADRSPSDSAPRAQSRTP